MTAGERDPAVLEGAARTEVEREASSIDYVSVVAGSSATYVGSSHIVASMNHPAAYTAPLAALVYAGLALLSDAFNAYVKRATGEKFLVTPQAS